MSKSNVRSLNEFVISRFKAKLKELVGPRKEVQINYGIKQVSLKLAFLPQSAKSEFFKYLCDEAKQRIDRVSKLINIIEEMEQSGFKLTTVSRTLQSRTTVEFIRLVFGEHQFLFTIKYQHLLNTEYTQSVPGILEAMAPTYSMVPNPEMPNTGSLAFTAGIGNLGITYKKNAIYVSEKANKTALRELFSKLYMAGYIRTMETDSVARPDEGEPLKVIRTLFFNPGLKRSLELVISLRLSIDI